MKIHRILFTLAAFMALSIPLVGYSEDDYQSCFNRCQSDVAWPNAYAREKIDQCHQRCMHYDEHHDIHHKHKPPESDSAGAPSELQSQG